MNISAVQSLAVSAPPIVCASTPNAPPPRSPSSLTSADTFVPDQLLVKVRPSLSQSPGATPAALAGFEVLRRFVIPAQMSAASGGALYLVQTATGTTVPQAVEALSKNPEVEYAEPNWRINADDRIPNDLDDRMWGLKNHGQTNGTSGCDIAAPHAWARQTGRSVTSGGPLVAVIDTGIDYTHPDLAANMWTNPREIPGNGIDDDGNGFTDDVHGADFLVHSGDPRDTTMDGHGTHVAGTIGAVGNNGQGVTGVAWNTSLMALRILHDYGGSVDGAIEAILYADHMGARVVNNSWGINKYSQALYDTLKASPALHVCAAGNSHRDIDSQPHYPAAFDLPNVLTVAASDDDDALVKSSNHGATSVDLSAPGLDIYSTLPNGQYGFKTGTSMAAPHVTGIAALLLAENPELTTPQLKARILETVTPSPALRGKTVTGGRVDAGKALG